MKKHPLYLFPFGMAALALLCFAAVFWLMMQEVQPLIWRTLVLLLPALILSFVGILSYKGKLGDGMTVGLTCLLSVVLLFSSVFYTFMLALQIAATETTDVRYYARALDQIEGEEGVDMFPEAVPENAVDVEFYYRPQYLQGGEEFELSYTASEEDIAEWAAKLTDAAEWVGSDEEWHDDNGWSFYGEDSTRYHLYWDGGFNHGEMSYALIDDVCRVTFYYSRW